MPLPIVTDGREWPSALTPVDPTKDIFYLVDNKHFPEIRADRPFALAWARYQRGIKLDIRRLVLLELGQSGYYLCLYGGQPLTFDHEEDAIRFVIPEPSVLQTLDDTKTVDWNDMLAMLTSSTAVSFYRNPSTAAGSAKELASRLGQPNPVAFGQVELSPVDSRSC